MGNNPQGPYRYKSERRADLMIDYLFELLESGVSTEREILIGRAIHVIKEYTSFSVSELLDPELHKFCKELRIYTDSYCK